MLIYNVPGFTGWTSPPKWWWNWRRPNIIGIKESGGDVEKIRRVAEATRQVKRAATVTETFDAVTPRMLKASTGGNGRAGNWCRWRASAAPTVVGGGNVVSGIKTRQKEVGFQIMSGLAQKLEASLQAGAVGGVAAFADWLQPPATKFMRRGKKAMRN